LSIRAKFNSAAGLISAGQSLAQLDAPAWRRNLLLAQSRVLAHAVNPLTRGGDGRLIGNFAMRIIA
jgi:hypothetical protein